MENKISAKNSAITLVASFVFCQLAILVFVLLATVVVGPFVGAAKVEHFFYDNAWGYLLLTCVLDGTLFAVWAMSSKGKENKIIGKTSAKKALLYVAITIIGFFALYPIINCCDRLLHKLNVPEATLDFEINAGGFVACLFSLVLLPAVCEELIFRGFILSGLKKHGKVFAIFFTSLAFAIFHMSLYQLVFPMLFGILLSCIMYNENNIIYTILMHLTNNLLALIVSYFNIPLVFNHFSYIILAFVLAIAFVAIVVWYMLKNNKTSKREPLGNNKPTFIFCFVAMSLIWVFMIVMNIVVK